MNVAKSKNCNEYYELYRTQRFKADFVKEIHLHFFDKCAHLFDNFF